ncbi:hypothetical protein [Methylobacterium fujisawaense]|uniref:hypothetical protein n=1 Tax=Methylobacterium fujisawaense TaxID=107400 RepID=UPI00313E5A7E
MRIAMVELMRLMAEDIVAEEAFAIEFAREAEQADHMGDPATADIMRDLSRRHRVKGLESIGRLAAMQFRYATMFDR